MRKITQREPSDSFKALIGESKAFSKRSSVITESGVGEYIFIKTERLKPYEKQARKVFDEESIAGLADTIKRHGIRQPLTVLKSDIEGEYRVISGERRLRAAKLLNMERVPCIILSDSDNPEEISLVENLQRVDLHPIELGEAYLVLLSEKEKWGEISELANKIGVSKQSLSEKLVYAQSIPSDIKDYVVQKNLRNRILLRHISKEKNIEKIKQLIGMTQKNKENYKKRSLLKIYSINQEVKAVISKDLSKEEKEQLRTQLKNFLDALS